MLCPFTGPKMFCASPNFLSQPKNLTAFSASSKPFVPAQKPILLNAKHLFVWHKMFVTATICKQIFVLAQKIWTSPKHFGTCKRTRHLCRDICLHISGVIASAMEALDLYILSCTHANTYNQHEISNV